MKISILGFVLGLLLLIIPLYGIYYFKLRVFRRVLVSFVRMALAVAVMSALMFGAVKLNSVAYDIILFVVLALLSAIMSLGKTKLNTTKLLLPVGVGSIVATAFTGFYFVFLVCGEKNPFVPNVFLPLMAAIACGMIGVNAKALQTYYTGLLHHGQLYNYIIGNGGTHREAIRYFVRRGLQASAVSVSKQMSRIVLLTSPAVMLSMVMCGSDIFTAFAFQVLLYVAVLSASFISLLIALLIGRKYSFDEYERLKPVFKKNEQIIKEDGEEATASQQSSSDSSSSHEELQHTDSESQPLAE